MGPAGTFSTTGAAGESDLLRPLGAGPTTAFLPIVNASTPSSSGSPAVTPPPIPVNFSGNPTTSPPISAAGAKRASTTGGGAAAAGGVAGALAKPFSSDLVQTLGG